MRVVVTGATGNVGTSVLDALGADPSVDSIVGLARQGPRPDAWPSRLSTPPTWRRPAAARTLPVPKLVLRIGADLSWRLRLQPTPPGWVDLAFDVPVLDCTRAHEELGWAPRWTAGYALLNLLGGFADSASGPTPALARRAPPVPA